MAIVSSPLDDQIGLQVEVADSIPAPWYLIIDLNDAISFFN